MYTYAYAGLTLILVSIWLILFALLPRSRSAMFWTGLILAAAGPISEFWALRGYWHPIYLIQIIIGQWSFGPEDYLYTFAIAGISAGLFENLALRKGLAELPRISIQTILRLTGWGTLGLLLMIFLGSGLRLNSIQALIIAVIIISLIMLSGRREIMILILPLAAIYALLYWLINVFIFVPIFPGVIQALWDTKTTWGINLAGIPLEEILWAFAAALFTGPVLRVCATSGVRPTTGTAGFH